jgi:hypothetical protein
MASDFAEKINVVEVRKPVFVVGPPSAVAVKSQKTVKLLFDELGIRVKPFITQHLPHLRLSGRIAYAGGPASQKGYPFVSGIPEMAVRKIGDHVPYMKAYPGRIAAHIKNHRPFVHKPGKTFGIGTLGVKPSFFQIIKRFVH